MLHKVVWPNRTKNRGSRKIKNHLKPESMIQAYSETINRSNEKYHLLANNLNVFTFVQNSPQCDILRSNLETHIHSVTLSHSHTHRQSQRESVTQNIRHNPVTTGWEESLKRTPIKKHLKINLIVFVSRTQLYKHTYTHTNTHLHHAYILLGLFVWVHKQTHRYIHLYSDTTILVLQSTNLVLSHSYSYSTT